MSQPICVFPQGTTLNISYSYMHGVEKVDLNSNKLAIKLDGYASAEKDYDDYYDSYEVVAYPELTIVDAFDNKLVNVDVDSETPEALQYFIIADPDGNPYPARKPYPYPKLVLKNKKSSIFDYEYEDFELVDYNHHPGIAAPVAV